MALTQSLADLPDGLTPMVAQFGDPEVGASTKVLAIMCLTPLRDALAPYDTMLTPFVGPDQPTGVRTLSTHALGLAGTEAAVSRVKALLEDEEQAVREAAMGVLVAMHGASVSEQLQAFWEDPASTTGIREQIVLSMAPELVASHLAIYADAVADLSLSPAARYKAATVLGQAGDSRHIPALEACIASEPDPYVRERAEGGVALLKASAGESPSAPDTAASNTGL